MVVRGDVRLRREDLLGGTASDPLRRATLGAMAVDPSVEDRETMAGVAATRAGRWLDFAERNRVGPLVAHALLRLLPSEHPVRARAEAVHEASARRMRVLLGAADRIAEALAERGIRTVALKNAGIARGLHSCIACCPMGDVDLLVPRGRYEEAHHIVQQLGFRFDSRAPQVEPAVLEQVLRGGGGEYVADIDGETVWIELQWRSVAGRWIRPEQEPDGELLVERSVPIDGSALRLLAPADNLLQVALHTAKHSYVRAPGLRLHTDVDRLVHRQRPDWGRLVERAQRTEIRIPVYFSLAMAQALLGTPIPERVLAELAPPRWKREAVLAMVRRADVFEPDEHKFSRPEMMIFHALLYDDAAGLLASATQVRRDELRRTPVTELLRRGATRIMDLVTRYQA